MVGLLHAMAFMVLLLVGWVIWNNKPLTIDHWPPHLWCQVAGAPLRHLHQLMMSCCPKNINENAQQSSGTYKISTTSLVHTCACVFWFSWEFCNVSLYRGFWGKSSNCFQKEKSPKFASVDNHLFNKLIISGIFLLLLSPNWLGKWLSSFGITCLNILNVFWKGRIVVIKSRVRRFSPCSFIFKSLRCCVMSAKNPTVSLSL